MVFIRMIDAHVHHASRSRKKAVPLQKEATGRDRVGHTREGETPP
jgi:hypothetical protein